MHQAWCETKFIKYRQNKLTFTKYVQSVHLWHEHKHASVMAIGQYYVINDTCSRCCRSSSVSW